MNGNLCVLQTAALMVCSCVESPEVESSLATLGTVAAPSRSMASSSVAGFRKFCF